MAQLVRALWDGVQRFGGFRTSHHAAAWAVAHFPRPWGRGGLPWDVVQNGRPVALGDRDAPGHAWLGRC
jgi:hypothetical protein